MTDRTEEKRIPHTVNLTSTANRWAKEVRADTNVPFTTVMENLLEWFARMPRKFRKAVIDGESESRDEMLIAWFRETIAAHGKSIEMKDGDDLAAKVQLIHKLVNDLHAHYEGMRDAAQATTKKKKG